MDHKIEKKTEIKKKWQGNNANMSSRVWLECYQRGSHLSRVSLGPRSREMFHIIHSISIPMLFSFWFISIHSALIDADTYSKWFDAWHVSVRLIIHYKIEMHLPCYACACVSMSVCLWVWFSTLCYVMLCLVHILQTTNTKWV